MVRRKYNNACGRWHRRTRTTEDPSPFRRAGRARGRTVKSSRTHHHGRGGVRSPGGEARGDARRAAAVRARVVVVVGSYHRYPCLLPRAAAPPAPSYGRAVARGTAAPAPHPTHPVQLEPSLPRDNYAHLPPAGLFPRPVCRARTPPARGAGQPAKPEPSSLPGRFLSLSPSHAFQQPAPHHAIGPFLLIPNLPPRLLARAALFPPPIPPLLSTASLPPPPSPAASLPVERDISGAIARVCVCGGGDVTRATWSPVDLPSREQVR
jgi:hypothetical protein